MSELPKGWIEDRLVNYLVAVPTGVANYEGEKEYYSTGSVNNGIAIPEGNFTFDNKPSRANRIVQKGDLLQARMKATNKALLVDDSLSNSLFSTGFIQLRIPEHKYDVKLAFYYLKSDCFLQQRDDLATGSTQEALTDKGLKQIMLPIPPFHEQKKIVEKLEILLSQIKKVNERLEKIPTILKRLRQSVLSSACSGKLTAAWREANVCTENNILNEVNNFYKNASKKDKKEIDEFQKFAHLNAGIEDSKWIKCNIGAIGKVCNGSTPSTKEPSYWNGSIPWVSSGEVNNNIINDTERKISEHGYDNASVKMLKKGTVLIAMIGEGKTRGQTAILNIDATINQNIAAVDLSHNMISSKYIWYWFQLCYQQNREVGNGSGPKALNCQRVRELELMLPPLHEQEEIVRRVDKLFALADKIELRYRNAKVQLARAENAIYAKAFRGELVKPQGTMK